MTEVAGRWRTRHRCVGCREVLTDQERSYSDGCCPHCGYQTNSTFCHTVVEQVRPIRDGRWPWSRIVRWEGSVHG